MTKSDIVAWYIKNGGDTALLHLSTSATMKENISAEIAGAVSENG